MSESDQRLSELQAQYDQYVEAGLKLDLTRGKPAAEQLDLANELDGILNGFYQLQDGTDVRNYGGIFGIPEARALGGELMGVCADNVLVGGNSSLTLMYHYLAHRAREWRAAGDDDIRFLCPAPGYDRHFTVCEDLGIDMITVPMQDGGPDMDLVESMVQYDPSIRGIWCVPKYSNPTGHTYSDATVERFAALPKLTVGDFLLMWDNAYAVHDLTDQPDSLTDIMSLAEKNETTDNVAIFASTSKITFAGAGIAFIATSTGRLAGFEKYLSAQTIGFDKINQLRHVHFLKDAAGIRAHMAKHRAIIKPKFDLVLKKLEDHLAGMDIACWTVPAGGYFISLDTQPGLASRVVAMAGAAGVKLTPAGATFPYGKDPEDQNIRIAPTFPAIDELDKAMDVFVTCIELATMDP